MPETRQQKAATAAKALEDAQRCANQQSNTLKSVLKKAKPMNSLRDRARGDGELPNTSSRSTSKNKKPWTEIDFILSREQARIQENTWPLYNDGECINPKQLHMGGEVYINPELLQMQLMEFASLEWSNLKLPDWMFEGETLGVAELKTSMLEETVNEIEQNFLEQERIFQRFGCNVANIPDQVLAEIEEKTVELDRKVQYSKEVLGLGPKVNDGHELDGDNLEQMEGHGLEGTIEVPFEVPESASEAGDGHEESGDDEEQMEEVAVEIPGSTPEVGNDYEKSGRNEKQAEELRSEDDIELANAAVDSVFEVSNTHEMDPYDVYDLPPPHPNAEIPDAPLRCIYLPIATTEYERNLVRQYELDAGLDEDLFPELAKYGQRPDPDFLGDRPDYLEAVAPGFQDQLFDYSSSRVPYISNVEFSSLIDDTYYRPSTLARKTKKVPAPAPVTPKKFYDQSPLKPHSSLPKRPDKVMVPSKYTPRPGDGSPPAKRSTVSQGHSVSSSNQGKDLSTYSLNVHTGSVPPAQQQQNNGSPKPRGQGNSGSFSGQGQSSYSGGTTHDSHPFHQQQRHGRGPTKTQGATGHHFRSFTGQSNASPTRSMLAPNQQAQHRSGTAIDNTTINSAARAFAGRVMVDSTAPQFSQPRQYHQGNGYDSRSLTRSPVRVFQAPTPARAVQEVIRLPFPQQDKRARAIQTIQQLFFGPSSPPGYTVAEEDGHVVVRGPAGGNLRGMVMSAFPGQRKVQSRLE
ncbi:hypothetical protein BDZ45DRAFT_202785 [Acephala macrosclerotiorum]|nr:hypothetical protein BDZ45DRAFT_202785 [Acephala macrosclerotiorum]